TGLLDDADYELYLGESPSIRNTRLYRNDSNAVADEYRMPKMVLRKDGENLQSTFITALEPYAATEAPRIEHVVNLPLEQPIDGAVAVAVSYGTTTDIILSSPHSDGLPLVTGDITMHG